MTTVDDYRDALRGLDDPEPFLLEHSGLPGPRGNIELAQAMADVGTRRRFERFLSFSPERAPVGSREEFLAFCAAVGFGRLAAEGDARVLVTLRGLASDQRWRVREGVAMGLQRLGASDMGALLNEMREWAGGNDFEQRAAAAALCEPALLGRESDARARDPRLDHRGPVPFEQSTERGVPSAAQGPGLLLERGRRGGARRRPAPDGAMDAQRRSRRPLGDEAEPHEEAAERRRYRVGRILELEAHRRISINRIHALMMPSPSSRIIANQPVETPTHTSELAHPCYEDGDGAELRLRVSPTGRAGV